ncbi:GntR family transcriptional regulator [Actinotalea caeni]|uniref:GntR family transcriptional regulator n=1 Tax=Actinotalea caeni TaxID=1348467 RepID=UPI0012E31E8D|nr:GntR family transcriptional regulator [Actinotalea caeni]
MSRAFSLAPSTLTDALYDAVRVRIINGELAPGEKLTEARLSSEYSVARPTAKACLERLTAAGLLRRSAHKSAVVPVLTVDELDDIFMARAAVERAAVSHLAHAAHVPEPAVRAQAALEIAAEQLQFPDQVAADIAFHTALVDAAGSTRLLKMHTLIMGEVHLTMGQFQAHRATNPSTVSNEHVEILQAIESGDTDGAVHALTEHLQNARARLVARAQATGSLPPQPMPAKNE